MKKLILLLGLLFVASFTFAQSNLSQVYQDGEGNIATVKQIGVWNEAYLDMFGDFNIIWQCQTGHENTEWFVINNGDYNATFQGIWWEPWHYQQFGCLKFYIGQLWDPSNTQHQFGHFNQAYAYIENSSHNLVSQTQGWKYHDFMGTPGIIVGNHNRAFIDILNMSDLNWVMQAQLLDNNEASVYINDKSDDNVALQYQFGFNNLSDFEITGSSDWNKVASLQGDAFKWSLSNIDFVALWDHSDYNEIIINQYDHGNYAEVIINDYSDYNKVAIHQENDGAGSVGSYAAVWMDRDADFNEMSICQWHGGGHWALIDIYSGDHNKIYTFYDGFFFTPDVYGEKVYTEIYFDGEYNVIRQEGANQTADIRIWQWGTAASNQADFNKVSILQFGSWSEWNLASIWIYDGSYNRAAISQEGRYHTAWIDIFWNSNNNLAAISQHTAHNFGYISITDNSDGNNANIVQADSWNNDGFNKAWIYMNEHDMGLAITNQYWKFNEATIVQEFGQGNEATIYQNSYSSWAYIYETGNVNFASICQHSFGFHWAKIVIDGNNNGFNNAIEGTSPYFKPSNPGYHNGSIFKVENWVLFDPTNMIRQEGESNYAQMQIFGNDNRSSIFQTGFPCGGGCNVNNEAYLDIYDGDYNITAQFQDGAHNDSYILIDDADHGRALSFQVGSGNDAFIYQYNGVGNMAGIDQFGHSHDGSIWQTGLSNEATINQYDWTPN